MFEILYKDPATIERYRLAPLLEDRERYLCAVVASGVVCDVAHRVVRTQLALTDLLNLPDADIPVALATVEAAVQEWCRNVSAVSAADFRRHAFRWLRVLGWLEEPVREAHPHARQVAVFAAWMRDDRGLSEATISNCCYESDRLFAWAAGRKLMFADMTIGDVDEFLAARIADGGLRRTSARAAAGCLWRFFRFAETRNWCRPGIAGCIMPPLAYPDRPVPKGFDRDEVERLLATTEGSTPVDFRDRAVLTILATCGLRAGEVGALRVEDILGAGHAARFPSQDRPNRRFPADPLRRQRVDGLCSQGAAGCGTGAGLVPDAAGSVQAADEQRHRDDRPQPREPPWHHR